MTRDEILNMPAGREMRQAMIDAGLWDANDQRDPSTDIAAAFDVIKEMCKKHLRYELGGNYMGLGHVYAAFDNEQWADRNPPSKAFADELPLAICRAALLAMEDK